MLLLRAKTFRGFQLRFLQCVLPRKWLRVAPLALHCTAVKHTSLTRHLKHYVRGITLVLGHKYYGTRHESFTEVIK